MKATALLGTLLFLTGCIQSHCVTLGDDRYAPRAANSPVEVLFDHDAPIDFLEAAQNPKTGEIPEGAVVIGRVDISYHRVLNALDSVLEEAKTQAREMGGDGVLISDREENDQYASLSVTVFRGTK